MSDVLASTAPGPVPEEEELIDVPEFEKRTDVLRRASIKRVLEGVAYYGTVEDIEQGENSGERLYRVKYTDGDMEHLTADQVRELSCPWEEVCLSTQPQVPVASPARNGTVSARVEDTASVSEADEKDRKSTDSVRKDIAGTRISFCVRIERVVREGGNIEHGKNSGDRLYLVKYTDGDVEHLTADQVSESSCPSEEVSSATQPKVPVALPARNGTVSVRVEDNASVSEADEKDWKLTVSVQKEIVKKPSSAAKATSC